MNQEKFKVLMALAGRLGHWWATSTPLDITGCGVTVSGDGASSFVKFSSAKFAEELNGAVDLHDHPDSWGGVPFSATHKSATGRYSWKIDNGVVVVSINREKEQGVVSALIKGGKVVKWVLGTHCEPRHAGYLVDLLTRANLCTEVQCETLVEAFRERLHGVSRRLDLPWRQFIEIE